MQTFWKPTQTPLAIAHALNHFDLTSFQELYQFSIKEKEKFLAYTFHQLGISFSVKPNKIIPPYTSVEQIDWCKGGKLNIIESILNKPSEHTAICFKSEDSVQTYEWTYQTLQEKIMACSAYYIQQGFQQGDVLLFCVPFGMHTVAAYLGAIAIGLVPALVADSFTIEELQKRVDIVKAKAVVGKRSYIYAGKKIDLENKLEKINLPIHYITEEDQSISFEKQQKEIHHTIELPALAPDSIVSVLFSSGTTSTPKAIPWTQMTPIKSAMDAYYHMDFNQDSRVNWTTGMGWMMAPWLFFSAFLNGSTLVLYRGAYHQKDFIEFCSKSKTTFLGLIPSLVKTWKSKNLLSEKYWDIKIFASTGEPSDKEDYTWLMQTTKEISPIIEYCGGTEIGGGYLTGSLAQTQYPGYFSTPTLGTELQFTKEDGTVAINGNTGETWIIPPALGLSQKLLNKNHHEVYYEGAPILNGKQTRKHGDAYILSEIGGKTYYRSKGRTDDAFNIGGIKVNATDIEEIINTHASITESAAIGARPVEGGPEKLVIYVVLKNSQDNLLQELQQLIKTKLNPLFRIEDLIVLEKLPRTSSNKVMRKELRLLYEKE